MLRAAFNDQFILFPTNWDEVSLQQFLRLDSGQPLMTALASDLNLLLQLPDAAADDAVMPYLAFTAKVPDFATLPIPDTLSLTVEGQVRKVKRVPDLGLETYGQKITVAEELRRLKVEGKYNYIDAALPLLSIYLYPQLSGKPFVDIVDTQPFESAILAMPCTVALPLAAFFLRKSFDLTPSGAVTYQLMAPPKRAWKTRLGQWFRS